MSDWLYGRRWWIWNVYVLAWTVGLLMPMEEGTHWRWEDLEFDRKFFFAKGLHLSAYAVLAGLTGWLRAPLRYRFVLMFFLMFHAMLTEVLQFSIKAIGRSGDLLDGAVDHVGVAIGMLATWRWWVQGKP